MEIILFSEISLDGKLTVAKRSSKEMLQTLSEEENALIQMFRKKYDAILIGGNTVRTDNPNLTYRGEGDHSPIRVILSNRLDFSFKENVFTDSYRTVVVTSSTDEEKIKKILSLGKEVLRLKKEEAADMRKVVALLEKGKGIHSMIVEGGGVTNWLFLKDELFDEVHLLQLPILVGGKDTASLIDGPGFSDLSICKNYQLKNIEKLKKSLYLHFTREVERAL